MKQIGETLVRHVSRRRSICAGIVLGVVLSYGIGAWLFVLREYADGRQTRSYLAQWLGASTLALPVVVLAVIAAVALAVRTLAPRGGPQQLITIGASAPAASLAFAATFPIRDALFGAGDSAALPAPVRVARDTLVALAIALPLAALGVSLFLSGRTRVTRTRAVVLAGGAAVLAAASLGGSVRAADPDPGQPCPATAPVKTFDVQAINVDIPLNRFGDHDPKRQDVRPSNRVADVRAEERRRRSVSIGLRDDADPAARASAPTRATASRSSSRTTRPAATSASTSTASRSRPRRPATRSARNARPAVGQGDVAHLPLLRPADDRRSRARTTCTPAPGYRAGVATACSASLVVEPPGSRYLEQTTGAAARVGLGGDRSSPAAARQGLPRVRSVYHEIGNEDVRISTKNGGTLPLVDPHTDAYRPGARAMNYRSEPFINRLDEGARRGGARLRLLHVRRPGDADAARLPGRPDQVPPRPRRRRDVPRLPPARWRRPLALQPGGRPRPRLRRHRAEQAPRSQSSQSTRLDSQSFGPGESYNLEIEGGAGGVQQAAGDFLFHCHIAEHYLSGMWGFWRVYDTAQPDLAPLPDRAAPPADRLGRS